MERLQPRCAPQMQVIEVDLMKGIGGVIGAVTLPEGVSGRFESGRKRLYLRPG